MLLQLIFILITNFVVFLWITLRPTYVYWRQRKVAHIGLFTSLKRLFLQNEPYFELVKRDCRKFSGKRYFGTFVGVTPTLFVTDIDLVKRIFIKDFDHFSNRLDVLGALSDPTFKKNLMVTKGKQWKELRTKISPAFTTARMKAMFFLMSEKAKRFVEHFDSNEKTTIEVELKDAYGKFTNDVIVSCAFGTQCDSFENPNNAVFVAGKGISNVLLYRIVWVFLMTLFPKLMKALKVNVVPVELCSFFKNMISDTIHAREKEGIIRPDLIHLLMEAKKGRLQEENSTKTPEVTGFATVSESSLLKVDSTLEITNDVIVAQALVFYIASQEASSTVLAFLSYELALNTDIQQKLIREVDNHISSLNDISFETLTKMKYLDQVISEALRKYPPAYVMTRICQKEYVIEPEEEGEFRLVIPRGSKVASPLIGTHYNPKYFENPDLFDPERFNDENKKNIVTGSYTPFGIGPRNCVGARFALLQMKCLVAALFSKFEVHITSKTKIPLELACTFPLGVKGGYPLALKKRNL